MPDLEGILPLILLMVFFWIRSMSAAVKKNRQRQERALEQGAEATGFEAAPEEIAAGAPPPAARPTLRDQLRDMGRQLEEQMQQAAEEGRPGSLVRHVDPEEAPETPPFLRPTQPARPVQERRPSPAPAAAAPPTPSGTRERLTTRAPPIAPRSSRRAAAGGAGPLERLDRYPPLAKAVILSEILGTPPGLSDREESPTSRN